MKIQKLNNIKKTMEKKLELADICMYLPYELKISLPHCADILDIEEFGFGCPNLVTLGGHGASFNAVIEDCKPILRPMSDLTKPTTHPDVNGGEEFVPLNLLASAPSIYYNTEKLHLLAVSPNLICCYFKDEEGDFNTVDIHLYRDKIQLLSKLHFDYNDLRSDNLCVYYNEIQL